MILSSYLGIGLAIVLGYTKTPFAGLASPKTGINIAFLFSSILIIGSSASHRCGQSTTTRERFAFVAFVGRSPRLAHPCWVFPGCIPLATSSRPSRYDAVPGNASCRTLPVHLPEDPLHLLLPAWERNIHFAFWAFLMLLIQLLKEGVSFEGRMLNHLLSCLHMILFLALVAVGTRCSPKLV